MPASRIPIVVAAVAAVVVAGAAVHQVVKMRRALVAERAARRLAAGMYARDMQAFAVRLNAAVGARAVLTEADLILDTALATYDTEGGRP